MILAQMAENLPKLPQVPDTLPAGFVDNIRNTLGKLDSILGGAVQAAFMEGVFRGVVVTALVMFGVGWYILANKKG